jgi:hypothetical protein
MKQIEPISMPNTGEHRIKGVNLERNKKKGKSLLVCLFIIAYLERDRSLPHKEYPTVCLHSDSTIAMKKEVEK